MRKFIVVVAFALLAGCAGAPGYQGMTAEQIAALAKMKDANVACTIVNTPWGRGVATFMNVDRGVIAKGAVTVDGDCKVTVTNEQPAPAAK